LVAVDGQHRLAALKQLQNGSLEQRESIKGWVIPVVILVPVVDPSSKKRPGNLLDVVRKVFSNINKEAREISKAREIILDDNSANSLAVQVLLDRIHQNDLLENKKRNSDYPPLYFFDWRGRESSSEGDLRLSSIFEIEELFLLIREYLLGKDFSDEQKSRLEVAPTTELADDFRDKRLRPHVSGDLRNQIGLGVVQSILGLFSDLSPLRELSRVAREIERKLHNESEAAAAHAYHYLRFGSFLDFEDQNLKTEAERILAKAIGCFENELLKKLPNFFSKKIGVRALFSALDKLWEFYKTLVLGKSNWSSFTQWFCKHANTAANSSLFCTVNDDKPTSAQKKFIELSRQLAHDHEGNIGTTLYRPDNVGKGYGNLLSLFILREELSNKTKGLRDIETDNWDAFLEDTLEEIQTYLLAGYKKEVRPALKPDLVAKNKTLKEINEAIKKDAEKKVSAHIKRLRAALEFK
jgi:hypothetical protein